MDYVQFVFAWEVFGFVFCALCTTLEDKKWSYLLRGECGTTTITNFIREMIDVVFNAWSVLHKTCRDWVISSVCIRVHCRWVGLRLNWMERWDGRMGLWDRLEVWSTTHGVFILEATSPTMVLVLFLLWSFGF